MKIERKKRDLFLVYLKKMNIFWIGVKVYIKMFILV